MRSEASFVGARGVDSYPFSVGGLAQQAIDLKKSGIDFFVGYLGTINVQRLKYVLDAGLAFMPVTLAAAYNGKNAVSQCAGLGLPKGCTVWLDVEGKPAYDTPAPDLMRKINDWANDVASAGYQPGVYVGAPQPLTSQELYSLRVVRYWKGIGRTVDKQGALAEPSCGWCMHQMHPSVHWAGVFVDVNIIGQDYKSRLPTWVRA
jgi:hypothetical protein